MLCFEPRHITLLTEAVEASIEHLRPFMTWIVHEPLSPRKRLEWIRTSRGHFDLDSDFTWGIFDKTERTLFGVAGLKLGASTDERELGYWLHVDHTGKGLALEAASALVRVGFDIEALDAIELRTDPGNERSARIAEKLGFSGPTLDPLSYPTSDGDKRDTHVYAMSRVVYAAGRLPAVPIEAYDALDRRLL